MRLHAVIPAAGTGTRVGANRPKQYLMLGAQTMLEHAVDAVRADGRIERVMVVLAPDDDYGAQLPGLRRTDRLAVVRAGGSSRAVSVRAGLLALQAAPDDWVLVHDAARPALDAAELVDLIDALLHDAVGGLLALPLADTLKRATVDDPPRVDATVDRTGLWRALTPQMFRAGLLARALDGADLATITDEASAVERLGLSPRLITGRASNIKVTTADDLPLARAFLAAQGRIAPGDPSSEKERA
ncbi:MAG: 2-C-methyl-D-erythritol 4-phosphate cytidylyltransferase [Betaproteobacteria bacterium]